MPGERGPSEYGTAGPGGGGDGLDTASIWLTCLLTLSLPLMVFDPMNPVFHRLQLSEAIALPTFALFAWRVVVRREPLPRPSPLFLATAVFVALLYLGSLGGLDPARSAVESTKILYLFALAVVIYLNGVRYGLGPRLRLWLAVAYAVVLAGGVLGGVLLAFGVATPLAHPTRIIGVALGIDAWLPVVPRITSFLRPTANVTGAYLAVLTLPVAAHLYDRGLWRGRRPWWLAALAGVCLFGLLTMSRTLSGLLLAVGLGLAVFRWQVPGRRFWCGSLLLAALGVWLVLQLYTVFYPVEVGLAYTADPTFAKEIVDLGSKQVPNPVYFLRRGVGLERLTLDVALAINHYAWLKYAGWKLLETAPWLGVGFGGFPVGVAQLAEHGVVAAALADYRSAQSQYFTILGETGVLGTAALALVLVLFLRRLYVLARTSADPVPCAVALAMAVAMVIAVDLDLLAFRWLWGLAGVALIPAGDAARPPTGPGG